MVLLGSPICHPDFVRAWADERIHPERQLLDHLPQLPNFQCEWLLLHMCASPRANHAIRTMPPPLMLPPTTKLLAEFACMFYFLFGPFPIAKAGCCPQRTG